MENLRSNDYRKQYFSKHHGFWGFYCCSYCGKLLTKEDATIDHIIPVNAAERHKIVAWLFRWKKEGINAQFNLTTACEHCNTSKKNRCGIWLFRGWIGRCFFPVFWFIFFITWPYFLSYAIAFFYVISTECSIF